MSSMARGSTCGGLVAGSVGASAVGYDRTFCKGYSLCLVASFGSFQTDLIFRILPVFLSPFFA